MAERLHDFSTHFIVLNQFCRLRKLKLPRVVALLSKAEITPVFSAKSGAGFYVFKKSTELAQVLSSACEDESCLIPQ